MIVLVFNFVFGEIFEDAEFFFDQASFNSFCARSSSMPSDADLARSITALSLVGMGAVIFVLLLASLVLLTFLDMSLESCDQPGLVEPFF